MSHFLWMRINPEGPGLHEPKRHNDVGWDLEAAESVELGPNEQRDVATNVRIWLPEDCWGEVRARSSIAMRGLQVDAGIIDTGYTGPLFVLLRNMNRQWRHNGHCGRLGEIQIEKGERIGQLILHYAYRAIGQEVSGDLADIMPITERGDAGWGSTGR